MKIFFTALFFILSMVVFSQKKVELKGKVLSKKDKSIIAFSTVKILDCKDSSMLNATKTSEEGIFEFELSIERCFILQIKQIGYLPYYKRIDDISMLNTDQFEVFELIESAQLSEIKLSADLEVLKTGIDKKIYNVSEDLTVKGGTANDILNRLPSVEVDQEGNIMLRGEGRVTILIDGKQSAISGGSGETLLDALPAGSIEKIEVVTNPSSKYDPDGTSGIINIVLKKNKIKGFNLFINSNIGTGSLRNGNLATSNLGLSYRSRKLNVYGTYSLNYYEGYRNNYSITTQQNQDSSIFSIRQNRTGTDFNATHSFKTGMVWSITDNHEIDLSVTGITRERNRTGDLWNSLFNQSNERIDLWQRSSFDPSQRFSTDADLNYKYDFLDNRGELNYNLHQSIGNSNIQGYYTENYFSTDSVPLLIQPLNQELFNVQKNNLFSSQLDLSIVYPEIKGRLESGLKLIHQSQLVDTYSQRKDTISGDYVEDTLADFEYLYNERVYSIYTLFGQQFDKFKYQFGVRGEMAYQIPELISEGILINNEPYLNLFPSVHIRYMIVPSVEMSLSYSKRINRPSSRNLNPFTNYSDPFNLRRGNPYLKPEYVDSYDFTIIKEAKNTTISWSNYYRFSTGVISRIKEYYENNTSAATFLNIAKTHGLGSELFANFKIKDWWKVTASWNGNYIMYFDDEFSDSYRSGYYHNFKINSSLDFWKKSASIQVSYVYNGKRVTLQGFAQRKGPTDIAFEKKFKDSKWTIGIRVSDVFNVQGFYLNIEQPNVEQVSTYKWLTRRYICAVSYKFGKLDNKLNQKISSGTLSD